MTLHAFPYISAGIPSKKKKKKKQQQRQVLLFFWNPFLAVCVCVCFTETQRKTKPLPFWGIFEVGSQIVKKNKKDKSHPYGFCPTQGTATAVWLILDFAKQVDAQNITKVKTKQSWNTFILRNLRAQYRHPVYCTKCNMGRLYQPRPRLKPERLLVFRLGNGMIQGLLGGAGVRPITVGLKRNGFRNHPQHLSILAIANIPKFQRFCKPTMNEKQGGNL